MINISSETRLKITRGKVSAVSRPTTSLHGRVVARASSTEPLSDGEEGGGTPFSRTKSLDLLRLHSYDHSIRTSYRESNQGLLCLDDTDPFRIQLKLLWRDNFSTMVGVVFGLLALALWFVVNLILKFDEPKTGKPGSTGFLHLFLHSDDDFQLLFVCAITFIATLSGLYAEIFLGTRITAMIDDEESKWRWLYSQFAFSFLVVTAAGCGSLLGLPFCVLAMFKFGYPEIISFLHRGHTHFHNRNFAFLADYMDGIGTLMHHSSAIFIITSLQMHYLQFDTVVITLLLPPILQHVGVKIKYFHKNAYIVITLMLEVWFQVEVFSLLGYVPKKAVRIATCLLVLSHWLYFLSGLLSMFLEREIPEDDDDDPLSFLDFAGSRSVEKDSHYMDYLSETEVVE